MKKRFFFLLISLVFLSPHISYAEDCMRDPIYDQDWNAIVTTGARVRNIPCMETSTVLTTLPVGEVIHVIAITDGWYKIERTDGTGGWVGQWLIAATDKPFNSSSTPPAVCTTTSLCDIAGHAYETAIQYLYDAKIVSGYSDNTFKPNATINRAEFTKIIIGATQSIENIYGSNCFPDVKDEWFAPYVCTAQRLGIIKGYPDGYFKPTLNINFAESAVMITNAFGYALATSDPWYKNAIVELEKLKNIPISITSFSKKISRGEMAEMIYRLKLNITNKDSKTYTDL